MVLERVVVIQIKEWFEPKKKDIITVNYVILLNLIAITNTKYDCMIFGFCQLRSVLPLKKYIIKLAVK